MEIAEVKDEEGKQPESRPREGRDCFQILAIFSISFAGCAVGSIFTWTSPSIPILISEEFPGHVTLEEASYLTVLAPLTAIIGSPLFPLIMDTFGRKKTLMLIAIPQILVWVIVILAEDIYMLYLSRLINGFSDACLFTVFPTYMSEITTPSVRGSWGNVPTISIYFGQFLVNAVGGYCSIKTTAYVMLSLPLLFLVTFYFMPESPYYLIMENEHEKAKRSLQLLRMTPDVDVELKQLISDVKRQVNETATWKDLFTDPTHRKGLWAGVFIRGVQQFSGLAAFSAYTVYLFQQGGSEISPTVGAMIFTFLLTALDAIGSFTLDKLGRRLAVIISCVGSALALICEAVYFYLKDFSSVDVSSISWFPMAVMFFYVVMFGIGLGIVPTLLIGELFSANVKAKGVCVLNISFCVYMIVCTKVFQYFASNFGLYTPFLLFATCCTISTFVVHLLVPETTGKTLEEIQQSMKPHNKEIS